MKKLYSALLLLFVSILSATSQNYYSFPTDSAIWTELMTESNGELNDRYRFFVKGDSLVDIHLTAAKLYRQSYEPDSIMPELSHTDMIGFLEEDINKRVYYCNTNCCAGTVTCFLLYDFSKELNDTIIFTTDSFNTIYSYPFLKVSKIDSILIGNSYRKRFSFYDHPDEMWIEGIGSTKSLLSSILGYPGSGTRYESVCFSVNNNDLYRNPHYDNCSPVHSAVFSKTESIKFSAHNSTLFPNPAKENDIVRIEGTNYSDISIFDLAGHKHRQYEKASSINTEGLKEGVYIVKAKAISGKTDFFKLLIETK